MSALDLQADHVSGRQSRARSSLDGAGEPDLREPSSKDFSSSCSFPSLAQQRSFRTCPLAYVSFAPVRAMNWH